MDFNVINVSPGTGIIVANKVSQTLFDTGRFVVIERSAMEAILQEQSFQKSGCTTNECAVEIGKLLNVKLMFVGDVIRLGEGEKREYTVSARVIDVESGRVIASKEQSCKEETELRTTAAAAAMAAARLALGEDIIVPMTSAAPAKPAQRTVFEDVLNIIIFVGGFLGLGLAAPL